LAPVSLAGVADVFTYVSKEGSGALVLGPVSLVSRAVLYALMETSGNVSLGALTLRAEAILGLHTAADIDLGVLDVSGSVLIAQDAAGVVILGAQTVSSGVYSIRKVSGSIELGGMTVESTVRPWVDGVGSITLAGALLAGSSVRGSNVTGNILLPTMSADGEVERDIIVNAAITLGSIQLFSRVAGTTQQLYRVTHIGTTQGGKYKLLSISATKKPTERDPNV